MNSPQPDGFEISTDRARLDIGLIHEFLRNSYWSRNIPRETVQQAVKGSLCFGAYRKATGAQAGFGRVVTDYATFGYMADVFVLPEFRRLGIGKMIVQAMVSHPDLQKLRRFMLATKDAHDLYHQFGFNPLASPGDFLTIHRPDLYLRENRG